MSPTYFEEFMYVLCIMCHLIISLFSILILFLMSLFYLAKTLCPFHYIGKLRTHFTEGEIYLQLTPYCPNCYT